MHTPWIGRATAEVVLLEEEPTDPMIARTAHADERIAGRYRVDRLLARGGMAWVYLAEQVDLARRVALKVLQPPETTGTVDFEARFRTEAKALAALSHPNIVTVHDFGQLDDGRWFLVMEYVEGRRLSDLLREGPLDGDHAIGLMLQVCAALRYAHQRGVVHRDLKPSNLLVQTHEDGTEHVKVVDFGLAKLGAKDKARAEGMVLGSPHCMAPEQVKGWDGDARTDIYAIGVLLYRVVTGRYPFHGSNGTETMLAHLHDPIPTFFAANPHADVPEGLEDVVRRCLAKQPGDRYPHMDALLNDLAPLVELSAEAFQSASIVVRVPSADPAEERTVPRIPVEASRVDRPVPTQAPAPETGPGWGLIALVLALMLLMLAATVYGVSRALSEGAVTADVAPASPALPEVAAPAEPARIAPADVPRDEPVSPSEPAAEAAGDAEAPTRADEATGREEEAPVPKPAPPPPARIEPPPAKAAPRPSAPERATPRNPPPTPAGASPAPTVPEPPPSAPAPTSAPKAPTPPPRQAPDDEEAPKGYKGLPDDF